MKILFNTGWKSRLVITTLLVLLLLFSLNIISAETETEHPAISNYKGAQLKARRVIDYAPYVLGIDDQVNKEENFRGHNTYFKEYIDLEGKLTRLQYIVPESEGIYKVFKNYEEALQDGNYQILFTTNDQESSWPFWNEIVYHREWGINAIKDGDFEVPFGRYGFYFLTAKGIYKENNIYFAIFFSLSGDNILITQDIIDINPLESGLVTAKKIEDNIALNGYISIYGIHFDSGKWNIKEDSKPALEEIAEFLNNNPEQKYYIVGHTDNVGNFQSNMILSKNRAETVMNALISDYGVNPEQLKAYGAASLSPVTSNSTTAGKARNRRVEIVEQ